MHTMDKRTLDDIDQFLGNSGYVVGETDFNIARQHNAFGYVGFKNGCWRYLVGFADDNVEELYYVSTIHVSYMNGKLCADFAGEPEFEASNIYDVKKFIDRVCQDAVDIIPR